MVGRSTTPSARTFVTSEGSLMPAAFIASQVRCTTRLMAAFLDIDLEQIAQVVERGRGLAEMALLFDRGWLGIALDHDQATQHGAMLARHFLPRRLAKMLAERDGAIFFLGRQQDAPAIFRHLDVVEL